jgi:hypothetical protein
MENIKHQATINDTDYRLPGASFQFPDAKRLSNDTLVSLREIPVILKTND